MSGFNTKIEFGGESYNIQTQDMGHGKAFVESLIYKSGRLLSSRRTFYTEYLKDPNLPNIITHLMEEQHKNILDEILEQDPT
mgnify:CR=1 FL=1